MNSRGKVICVSTTKPTTSLTPGGGGGSLALLCPHTGSIQSSLRISGDMSGKVPLGVSSLSTFPPSFSGPNTSLAMAYGSTSKKDDTYGMLLTLRSGSSSPMLHWKCRVPEPRLTGGLIISPCGTYSVGGGSSGTIYIWKTLGGALIRSVKAHYRSVTVMEWTPCGRHLATGGADGMVHVFSLLDLVEQKTNPTSVQPVRTWSNHHLPVTALTSLTSGRMASASEDGQVIVIEVFSEATLATIQMPHAIRVLTSQDHRLFAGDKNGSIYLIDLDEYAVHQTAQLGATVKRRNATTTGNASNTAAEQVFGSGGNDSAGGIEEAYTVELSGHDRAITALAFLDDRDHEWLVSGDEAGVLRVWDLESRGCVRVMQPWSHSAQGSVAVLAGTAGAAKSSTLHPVTSIRVLQQDEDPDPTKSGMYSSANSGGGGGRDKNAASNAASLVKPLDKFVQPSDQADRLLVPFLKPKRDVESLSFWDVSSTGSFSIEAALHKRRRLRGTKAGGRAPNTKAVVADNQGDAQGQQQQEQQQQQDEILRLQNELQEANSAVQRWEKVNNTLMAKLKQK
jgi:WD40 repeat protein